MFETRLEIRYYETDMQGIVHHSNYLRYLEVAREKLILEKLGMGSQDFEDLGIFYVIREAETKFLMPIRFGDELLIRVRLAEYNGLRLVHEYELVVDGNIHATARTMMVSIDKDTFKPLNMRKKFKQIHEDTLRVMDELNA